MFIKQKTLDSIRHRLDYPESWSNEKQE